MQVHVAFMLAVLVFEVLTESLSISHLVAHCKEEFLPTRSPCLGLS